MYIQKNQKYSLFEYNTDFQAIYAMSWVLADEGSLSPTPSSTSSSFISVSRSNGRKGMHEFKNSDKKYNLRCMSDS